VEFHFGGEQKMEKYLIYFLADLEAASQYEGKKFW